MLGRKLATPTIMVAASSPVLGGGPGGQVLAVDAHKARRWPHATHPPVFGLDLGAVSAEGAAVFNAYIVFKTADSGAWQREQVSAEVPLVLDKMAFSTEVKKGLKLP